MFDVQVTIMAIFLNKLFKTIKYCTLRRVCLCHIFFHCERETGASGNCSISFILLRHDGMVEFSSKSLLYQVYI